MNDNGVLSLLISTIEDFFRNESHPSVECLDITVQDNSGEKTTITRRSNLYGKVSTNALEKN